MRELLEYFAGRVKRDGIAQEAAALAYTTILSLVPLLTVVVSLFAMIPSFDPAKEELKKFVSDNFMPVFTDAIGNQISSLVEHAGSMALTSILALFCISLLLIRSIDKCLNRIWRGTRRRVGMTIAIYWTLLTLGPLACGLVIWLSTRMVALALFYGESISGFTALVYSVVPLFVEVAIVTTLFMAVPSVPVRLKDALSGGALFTVMFEVGKKLFSAFILNFSNYEAMYGALAALPVLMIWIYIDWWLILIAAEFTATLGLARGGMRKDLPALMLQIASATGGTVGSQSAVTPLAPRRRRLRIKISRRLGS
ncbi:MAG: YihY family inner membrane protein [Succinivibrionaceae bacterium]|nr:YihY family inner membrane protein [Succinivibrionaceae bacterium]